MKQWKKFALLAFFIAIIIAFVALDLKQYFSLDYAKENLDRFQKMLQENPVTVFTSYFGFYVFATAASLPVAAILTLLAGALFGFWKGLLLVSFASTIGASIAFLVSRYILQEGVQTRYQKPLKKINEGIKKEGGFYLFALRLVPLFPFFMINIVMGITKFGLLPFFIISQIGMLPGTAVYVFAGTQLATIDSLQGILSSQVILAFTLLGVLPIIAKKLVAYIRGKYYGKV